MSRLFFLKALIFLFPLFSGLHAQATPSPLSHVMVLGEVKDEDLTKLESFLPQKMGSLPSLDYDTPSFQEKRKQWIQFFSKTLLEERLSFRLGDSVQCFFFPSADHSPLNACALIGQEDELATLETSLLELQQISLHGITEWELTKAKEQVWDQLYNTSSELAEKSSVVLQSISTKDIQKYLSPLYAHVADDLNLNGDIESEYEEDSILVQLCSNQVNDINPFYSLAISDSDKKTIHWVIHTLAKWNKFKLLANQKAVRKKGDKVEHVHPLRFLSYVIGEGGLRGDMQKIKKDRYKWSNFMDNFTPRFSREAANNNLMQYVPGFANSLGIDAHVIQSYVERRDWHGLVNHFL